MANHWMRLMDNVCFMVNDYRLLLERQSGGHVSSIESPPTALASLLYCCWIALIVKHSPLLSTPSPAGLSARRNGNCDPQRAQNDIQSFF